MKITAAVKACILVFVSVLLFSCDDSGESDSSQGLMLAALLNGGTQYKYQFDVYNDSGTNIDSITFSTFGGGYSSEYFCGSLLDDNSTGTYAEVVSTNSNDMYLTLMITFSGPSNSQINGIDLSSYDGNKVLITITSAAIDPSYFVTDQGSI